ncbi:hypothetical protein EST38_g6487 [Candolleomyces aberdarensis]|uniref:Uncharacterized protein n=1 Tax=Candolleomyces aberdarensis TaxID=2316362 RepID=A0A4V1Q3Q1_9AGAR|nr:hypothetical protein EST38_g6487 [Candolleomyces aberdarensis]
MAAPTQEYPPWLTPSEVVGTNAAGQVVTSTTIVYLPLTYLGPSIPLNTLFTYGGSTYPPTIVTGFITTTPSPTVSPTSSTTSPATPPTSVTTSISSTSSSTTSEVSSTTTIPTVSSASSSTTTSSLTTIPPVSTSTTTPTTSFTTTSGVPTATSSSSGGLSRGQLVGVIVASILGLIFLFVFLLAMWLWCKGRRNRRSGVFSTITPIDDDYFIVGEDSGRTPGEGSPRHSGEEADPFLQRSRDAAMAEVATEMGSRPGVPRVPPPLTGSLSSSGSSSTGASGYGVLLERPTLGVLPTMAEEGELGYGGYRLSEDEMRELNRESVLPQEDEDQAEYTGAYAINNEPLTPPPRIMDPDNAFAPVVFPRPPPASSPNPRSSVQSNPSLVDAEDAALLTARRVQVGDLTAPPGSSEAEPSAVRTRFLDAIGLAGLTGLGRTSWFGSGNTPPATPPRNSRHSPGFSAVPLSENDIETGRNLFQPELGPDSFGRNRGIGMGPDGVRPGSGISGRSGTSAGTIWHDATSSLPGTPGLAPPPRALTPAGVALPEHAWLAGQVPVPPHSPPAYDDPFIDSPASANATQVLPPDVDILDLPAPTALSHFTSSSSMHDTGTVSSVGLSKHPYPPGLEHMKTKTWSSRDGSLSAASSSPAWHQVTHGVTESEHQAPGVVDILEEEPPNATTTWRSMATGPGGASLGEFGIGRRTTFGLPQFTHPNLVSSEQGSLHSMRSHIGPPSIRSTGSAAASRRDGSGSLSSTSSSRPSTHSASSSISHSLVRAGSIISEGRRRFDPHLPPPPMSAFGMGPGHRGFQTPPRAATPADIGMHSGFKHGEVPTIDGPAGSPSGSEGIPMPSVHFSPGASTIRTVGSSSTAMQVDAEWVPVWAREELAKETHYASSSNSILVTSTTTRSQAQNIDDCLSKLHEIILTCSTRGLKNVTPEETKKRVEEYVKAEKAHRRLEKDKRSEEVHLYFRIRDNIDLETMAGIGIINVLSHDVMEIILEELRRCDSWAHYCDMRLLCKTFNEILEPRAFLSVTIGFTKQNMDTVLDLLPRLASGTTPHARWARHLRVHNLVPLAEDGRSVWDHLKPGPIRERLLACQNEWLIPAIKALPRVEEAE